MTLLWSKFLGKFYSTKRNKSKQKPYPTWLWRPEWFHINLRVVYPPLMPPVKPSKGSLTTIVPYVGLIRGLFVGEVPKVIGENFDLHCNGKKMSCFGFLFRLFSPLAQGTPIDWDMISLNQNKPQGLGFYPQGLGFLPHLCYTPENFHVTWKAAIPKGK